MTTMTARERAEALFPIERRGGIYTLRHAHGSTTTSDRVLVEKERARLAAPIAAALEAAARDATEAAAKRCDEAEDAARGACADAIRRGDKDAHEWAAAQRSAARDLGAAIRAGGTGGEHGQ